jgi:DHA2 family multidrug resistance protein
MPFIGKLMQRGFSAKLLAGMGFFLFFVFTVMLGGFNGSVGSDDFFWPLIVRGVGMGMIFIPLTTLALGQLKGAQIAQGSAMTNMMRQLGGSVGIAMMTSFVERRMIFHKAVLSERVTATSPETWSRLQAAAGGMVRRGEGTWEAQRKAVGSLLGTVSKQAALMSYLDAFRLVGLFFLVCLPLLLLFKKPGHKVDTGSMHAE